MAKIKSTKDLILQLCYAKGRGGKLNEPIVGKVRLMKMVFLFEKEIRKEFNKDKGLSNEVLGDFEAYSYGPYSKEVYNDLEFLVNLGFICVDRTSSDDSETEFKELKHWSAREDLTYENDEQSFPWKFYLSDIGKKFVSEGKAGGMLSSEQRDLMDEFKSRCTRISLKALLKYVYSKYPDFTTKSKIRDEILA